jgi:hypothetical protein
MVTMMKNHPNKPAKRVLIAGQAGAGTIACVAAALSKQAADGLAVDLEGFRFAKLTSSWDHQFVPGAVKYADIEGVLAICDPLTVSQAVGAEGVAEAAAKMAK